SSTCSLIYMCLVQKADQYQNIKKNKCTEAESLGQCGWCEYIIKIMLISWQVVQKPINNSYEKIKTLKSGLSLGYEIEIGHVFRLSK
ncbi:hypothetical protein L9F63_013295, partial [Diploptera punctata]